MLQQLLNREQTKFISSCMMILDALRYYFCRPKSEQKADTRPAPDIDLSRYLGRWYELARFDTPFEKDMEEVYTEYRAKSGGEISVTNVGMGNDERYREAHAIAYPTSNGRLRVSFIPLLRFLSTPYNILRVDEDYRYALVSNDSGSCLWFLGRHPVAAPEAFEELRREAIRRGFDLRELHYTRQHRPFPD